MKSSNGAESKPLFTGRVRYNENAIIAFCKVQFSAFRGKKQIGFILGSLIMLLAGVSGRLGGAVSTILVLLGCWGPMYLNSIPKNDADKLIKAFDGKFPTSVYSFDRDGFDISSGKDKNRIGFDNIIRLIEDDEYFYFFAAPQVAYVVDKSSLSPADADGFMRLASERTELEWTKARRWYSVKLSTLIKERKNTKKIPK